MCFLSFFHKLTRVGSHAGALHNLLLKTSVAGSGSVWRGPSTNLGYEEAAERERESEHHDEQHGERESEHHDELHIESADIHSSRKHLERLLPAQLAVCGMDPPNSTNVSNQSSVFTDQVLPSFYCIIFVVGVPLNVTAAWIFFRLPGDSGLVIYLKNMVVADLLMLSTFPFKAARDLNLSSWDIHVITCRYTAVLFYFSMYVGIHFIGVISLERYIKVVHYSSSSTSSCKLMFGGVSSLHLLQKPRFARMLALFSWGLLFLLILPNVILTSKPPKEKSFKDCMQLKTPLGITWHKVSVFSNLSVFWLTLIIVTFCYTSIAYQVYKSYRRLGRDSSGIRHKSNRGIFSILAVFFVCFVPFHICRVPFTQSQTTLSDFSDVLYLLKEGTLFLSALNVCLDPVIYFLMCRSFRQSLLRKLSLKQGRRSPTNTQSLSNMYRERTVGTQDK
ncbi:P2Y purinoceptor 14-like [Xenentodon cancila]